MGYRRTRRKTGMSGGLFSCIKDELAYLFASRDRRVSRLQFQHVKMKADIILLLLFLHYTVIILFLFENQ